MSGFLSGWNLLPRVPGSLDTAVSRAVRKAAFDIQGMAMAMAPVDTGFLKNSIYVVTHDASTYERADLRASGKNSDAEMLPEIDEPPNDRTAYVAVGADYGLYVEFGTANAPAQPYLLPAAEFVKPQYLKALSGLEGVLLSLLGSGGSVDIGVATLGDDGSYGVSDGE